MEKLPDLFLVLLAQSIASVDASISGFETLSGMEIIGSKRVVVANANGAGKLIVVDLSVASEATVVQTLGLETPLRPITTLVVDVEAQFAYATVGDCADGTDGGFVAVRLAPSLAQVFNLASFLVLFFVVVVAFVFIYLNGNCFLY